MLITLQRNQFQPISIVDLQQVKKTYLRDYSSYLKRVGKFISKQFKATAFYSFFLIASTEVD